jgi:hypothetical protein
MEMDSQIRKTGVLPAPSKPEACGRVSCLPPNLRESAKSADKRTLRIILESLCAIRPSFASNITFWNLIEPKTMGEGGEGRNSKFQIPSSNSDSIPGAFGTWIFSGAWILELGTFPPVAISCLTGGSN